jgi:hypothetical protein
VKLNQLPNISAHLEPHMDCVECQYLRAELKTLEDVYQLTCANLIAARTSADAVQYAQLLALADEAKLDLDRVDAEIRKHQDAAHASR